MPGSRRTEDWNPTRTRRRFAAESGRYELLSVRNCCCKARFCRKSSRRTLTENLLSSSSVSRRRGETMAAYQTIRNTLLLATPSRNTENALPLNEGIADLKSEETPPTKQTVNTDVFIKVVYSPRGGEPAH